MKKAALTMLYVFVFSQLFSQGSMDFSITPSRGDAAKKVWDADVDFTEISKFGLIGIGNLNTETFKELNSSGKLSGYVRPVRNAGNFLTLRFAFNVNASNTDSIMPLTFLFPDVGRNSFLLDADYSFALDRKSNEAHLLSPFFEFSTKNIRATRDDQERYFSTLNYVAGARYQYYFKEGDDEISFTSALYYSVINVPNEDNKDFRHLFTGDENSALKSSITALGTKFTLQVNRFQIFADLKNVYGNDTEVPVRELKGFNANVGVVFNATIFQK